MNDFSLRNSSNTNLFTEDKTIVTATCSIKTAVFLLLDIWVDDLNSINKKVS